MIFQQGPHSFSLLLRGHLPPLLLILQKIITYVSDHLTLVVHKCPKCGGQVKLEEQWKEGFCVYCGLKVKNSLVWIRLLSTDRIDTDSDVEKTMNDIVEELNHEKITEASDIQRIKESMQTRFMRYGDKFRDCRAKYANDTNEFCHRVGSIPYEATKNTWEELKESISKVENGCAICMAYNEFTDAYLSSIDKLSSVLKMKWESSSILKRRNAPNVDKKELIMMRNKLYVAEAWLRLYSKN